MNIVTLAPTSPIRCAGSRPRRPGIVTSCLLGVVLVLASGAAQARNLARGETVYRDHCEVCHGAGGYPSMPGVPDFTLGDGLMQPDFGLEQVIREGRNTMPGYDGVLSNTEIADVITYLRSVF